MRAGEKRGVEAVAFCAWRGRTGSLGRGEGADRGEARRGTPVQRAVFGVVQVICRKRRKLLRRPGRVAVVIRV